MGHRRGTHDAISRPPCAVIIRHGRRGARDVLRERFGSPNILSRSSFASVNGIMRSPPGLRTDREI